MIVYPVVDIKVGIRNEISEVSLEEFSKLAGLVDLIADL